MSVRVRFPKDYSLDFGHSCHPPLLAVGLVILCRSPALPSALLIIWLSFFWRSSSTLFASSFFLISHNQSFQFIEIVEFWPGGSRGPEARNEPKGPERIYFWFYFLLEERGFSFVFDFLFLFLISDLSLFLFFDSCVFLFLIFCPSKYSNFFSVF